MQEETRTALPVRMLLVDDDADFTRIFQISLRGEKRSSFEVETAHTLESALQMLREKTLQLILLQPEVIKIDKRLVQNISHDKNQKEMLRRLLTVVESLHAKIIAEGIESREDLEALKELGVPYGQGFLWGQPA